MDAERDSRPSQVTRKKSRYTEEQIIAALKEVDALAKLQDVVRRLGVTEQTYYRWKARLPSWSAPFEPESFTPWRQF